VRGKARRMRRTFASLLSAALLLPTPALAWGYEGHRVVATIARGYLQPAVRAKVDAILAQDADTLTGTDMAARATWADAWRGAGHRETAQWHFADVELDGPDLANACFGYPAAEQPASAGPARDCVVDKVREFAAELAAPATPPAERLLALKYLLHFVGDLHQPLHAADNHDRGGNCVLLSLGGTRTVNLHSYWDTVAVEALGRDPDQLAATLRARIKPAQAVAWQQGDAATWAMEAFQVARTTAYRVGSPAGCQSDAAPIAAPAGYDAAAQAAVALQLERAGVRLASVLNRALAKVAVAAPAPVSVPAAGSARPAPTHASTMAGRTPESLACSADADARGLHGKERQRFRRGCIRDRRAGG